MEVAGEVMVKPLGLSAQRRSEYIVLKLADGISEERLAVPALELAEAIARHEEPGLPVMSADERAEDFDYAEVRRCAKLPGNLLIPRACCRMSLVRPMWKSSIPRARWSLGG
jgi:hypothetical protein